MHLIRTSIRGFAGEFPRSRERRRKFPFIALAVVLATSFAREARADDEPEPGVWDIAPHWTAGTMRFSTAVHVTTIPDLVTLCTRSGRSCSDFGTADTSQLTGPKRVVANALELALEPVAVGPFRFGAEIGIGLGHGPSGTEHGITSSWSWGSGGFVLGVRMRGHAWAAFADVVPGIVGVASSLRAPQHGRYDVATATLFLLSARLGAGVRVTPTTTLFAFGGGGTNFGTKSDVTGGLRFAWTPRGL